MVVTVLLVLLVALATYAALRLDHWRLQARPVVALNATETSSGIWAIGQAVRLPDGREQRRTVLVDPGLPRSYTPARPPWEPR